jgi:hypothetical protein
MPVVASLRGLPGLRDSLGIPNISGLPDSLGLPPLGLMIKSALKFKVFKFKKGFR